MELTQIFQLFAVGIGLVGVVSTAAIISRSTVVMQNNNQLRNAYNDARNALSDEEKKNARLEGELSEIKARAKVLEELVTGRAAVDELAHEVRTLTGIVRSDYAHLSPRLEMIIQGGIARGSSTPPDGA